MSKKKSKYSKGYHVSMNKEMQEKLESLEKQMETAIKEGMKKFPFKEDERVAIMDCTTRKFKCFAFIQELQENLRSTTFYVKYQRESKTGKRERTIMTLMGDEFIVPADEADSNDKMEPFKLDYSKIDYKF